MKLVGFLVVALAACGPNLVSLKVTNATDRTIEEVHINHGASRGTIAAHGTMMLSIAAGNIDVTAVSAKVKVAEHENERREASSAVELKHPTEVIFYDAGAKPADLQRDGVVGVSFTTDKAPAVSSPAP